MTRCDRLRAGLGAKCAQCLTLTECLGHGGEARVIFQDEMNAPKTLLLALVDRCPMSHPGVPFLPAQTGPPPAAPMPASPPPLLIYSGAEAVLAGGQGSPSVSEPQLPHLKGRQPRPTLQVSSVWEQATNSRRRTDNKD